MEEEKCWATDNGPASHDEPSGRPYWKMGQRLEARKMSESEQRRARLWELLQQRRSPVTGSELAALLNVSRQIIVQDVALLRAQGKSVIATPRGYLALADEKAARPRRTVAVKHSADLACIERELTAIVDEGGHVIDVIVEHPIYGELRGVLMLQSRRDVQEFLNKMEATGAEPLSSLTDGVHLHTIEAESHAVLDRIEQVLDELGFTERSWTWKEG